MAVCSEIHTEHIKTAVWAERGIVNVKPNGAHSDQWALKANKPNIKETRSNAESNSNKFHEVLS